MFSHAFISRLDLYLDSNDRVILLNGAYHLIFMDAELNFLENVQFGTREDKGWDCAFWTIWCRVQTLTETQTK